MIIFFLTASCISDAFFQKSEQQQQQHNMLSLGVFKKWKKWYHSANIAKIDAKWLLLQAEYSPVMIISVLTTSCICDAFFKKSEQQQQVAESAPI